MCFIVLGLLFFVCLFLLFNFYYLIIFYLFIFVFLLFLLFFFIFFLGGGGGMGVLWSLLSNRHNIYFVQKADMKIQNRFSFRDCKMFWVESMVLETVRNSKKKKTTVFSTFGPIKKKQCRPKHYHLNKIYHRIFNCSPLYHY